jgi:fatty-acyl-CoA synthase
VSRFIEVLVAKAAESTKGLTTGEPAEPVWRSWKDLHAAALRGAARLAGAGVRRGGAVALLAGDVAQVVPAAQAVWLAGGSVTVLPEPVRRDALDEWRTATVQALRTLGVEFALVGAPYGSFAEVLREQGVPYLSVDELEAAAPADGFEPVATGEDDIALLQLTSGSTALPKAVRISHGNLHADLVDMIARGDVREERDVTVCWAPMSHSMGMVGCLLVAMAAGSGMVAITPADLMHSPGLWPELISRYRGTVTAGPNFAYALMTRYLQRAEDGALDLSSLRIAINGGEPIDPETMHALVAAGSRFGLTAESVNCSYGATESTVVISMSRTDEPMAVDVVDAAALEKERRAVPALDADGEGVRRYPLLGYPLPSLEVRIVGEDGAVLGEREVGAIQLRGGPVATSYRTADGIEPTLGADGWLDVGDEGYFAGGQLAVCGRTKDVVIAAGRNIYVADIDHVAAEADGVWERNAVTVRLGFAEGQVGPERETFAVLVESARHADPDAAGALAGAVAARVLSEIGARPARILVLPPGALPKTTSGKIHRTAARALL